MNAINQADFQAAELVARDRRRQESREEYNRVIDARDAARAGYRELVGDRFDNADVERDLEALHDIACELVAHADRLEALHAKLDAARIVQRGLRYVPAAFDVAYYIEEASQALELSFEAAVVLAAEVAAERL